MLLVIGDKSDPSWLFTIMPYANRESHMFDIIHFMSFFQCLERHNDQVQRKFINLHQISVTGSF